MPDRITPYREGGDMVLVQLKIIAAAIRLQSGGVCYRDPPARHGDLISIMSANCTPGRIAHATQGFLTSDYKFVDRVEAKQIAVFAGQITTTDHEQLFSEDLW